MLELSTELLLEATVSIEFEGTRTTVRLLIPGRAVRTRATYSYELRTSRQSSCRVELQQQYSYCSLVTGISQASAYRLPVQAMDRGALSYLVCTRYQVRKRGTTNRPHGPANRPLSADTPTCLRVKPDRKTSTRAPVVLSPLVQYSHYQQELWTGRA